MVQIILSRIYLSGSVRKLVGSIRPKTYVLCVESPDLETLSYWHLHSLNVANNSLSQGDAQ